MAYFVLRPLAQEDLAETYSFVSLRSEARAETWLEKIEVDFQSLAYLPEMGRIRSELPGNVRSFPSRPYVIFYRPILEGVEIVRVLHGARDLGSIDFATP